MSPEEPNPLVDLLGIDSISERTILFIWIALSQSNSEMADLNFLNLSGIAIARELDIHHDALMHIRQCLRKDFIPTPELNWIENSRRQASWLTTIATRAHPAKYERASRNGYNRSLNERNELFVRAIPRHLHGRLLSIAILDYWLSTPNSTLAERISRAQHVRLIWDQQKKADKRLEWFRKDDAKARRAFFWDWLEDSEPELIRGNFRFESHEDLLIFFDNPRFPEFLPIDLAKRARTTWVQRRRRERDSGKRQRNFLLTEATISNLKKLALKHGLNHTKVIEKIINAEMEQGKYLDAQPDSSN